MTKNKKTPTTIEEARAALQIVQIGKEFYIVCKNQNQDAKLYKLIFSQGELHRLLNDRKEKIDLLLDHEKRIEYLESELNEIKTNLHYLNS